MSTDQKQPYSKPEVADHGDLTAITAAGQPHGNFDANYAVGTPIPPGGPGSAP